MGKHYNEQFIARIIAEHTNGISSVKLSEEYGVARSTVCRWIQEQREYQEPITISVSARNIYENQKLLTQLQIENDIMKKSGCTPSSPLHEKLEAIVHLKDSYTIYRLCKTLNVLKSTYLYHIHKSQTIIEKEDEMLKEKVIAIFNASKQRFGSKKIRIKLMEEGIQTSQRRIVRLMRELGLSCDLSKRHRIYAKPDSNKVQHNLLNQDFIQPAPNMAWVSDITYLYAEQKRFFLCVVIDLFSRMILSYKISEAADTVLVADTFNTAYYKRHRPKNLLFHSDKGIQYTSEAFCRMLYDFGVKQSFSKTAYPYDNAVAESFFSSLKREEVNRCSEYNSFQELKDSIDEYIHHFNYERPHQSLGYHTPAKTEEVYFT